MRRLWPGKTTLGYVGVLTGCFLVSMLAGWWLGNPIDNGAYDLLFRLNPPPRVQTQAVVVGIDDATFAAIGGTRRLRPILTKALERIAEGQPKVVAIDILLHDQGSESADIAEDAALAASIRKNRTVIMPTNLDGQHWEDPAAIFVPPGVILGHIKADIGSRDGVTREIPLSQAAGRTRRWAMALEAFRIAHGSPDIVESPDDLEIGGIRIPTRYKQDRPLRILYSIDPVPFIPVVDLIAKPELAAKLKDKVVFLGVTSLSFSGDRIITPIGAGHPIPGVEVHGQAYETLERGLFMTMASDSAVLGACVLVTIVAGLIFARLVGWLAYLAGAALIAGMLITPFVFFRYGVVFPAFEPLLTAWLTVVGAATYQGFVVRGQLRKSEVERARYRQAIHFVTHEMRSPLTAIQGSSELMGRYNLNEDKRKQMAAMINSESKRLARMIQTFLDVERLADGQMELKRDPFSIREMILGCLDRVQPLAERKSIVLIADEKIEGEISGDRELLEYAVYNLLTNAVKYSPAGTEVAISCRLDSGFLRLAIKDQGMGMEAHELKQIFTRFYRTKRAEASGESGTGIGLSIVDQIVKHHGGRMEVTSSPGKGSCFTVLLPSMASYTGNKEGIAVEKKGVRES